MNTIDGTDGNDTLTSKAGDDHLNGGLGIDTAVYVGPIKDYLIGLSDGMLTIRDNNPVNGDDGLDQLTAIEKIRFAKATLTVYPKEFQVNTYSLGSQADPSITALTDGCFVVTWQSDNQDGSDYGIYGQRYDAVGRKAGSEFQVNTYATANQLAPSITSLAGGGFVVTWSSYGQDGSEYGIYGQRYDVVGNKAGSEFQINTYTTIGQETPAITTLKDGGFVVTWLSVGQDGFGDGIYGQRFDASGNKAGGEFQVNTNTTLAQKEPCVTALMNGGFVVMWQSDGQDGPDYGIYGQRYDAAGNKAGNEFQVNTYTVDVQFYPSITALTSGGFVVTWTSNGQDGSSHGIYGQRYDAVGNKTGNEFQINTYSTHGQGFSSITALTGGGFVVTWNSGEQDGSSSGVYAQRYNAAGNKISGEFRVNTYTLNYQGGSSTTALADGGFVVTWHSDGQDGSGYGIYAQRYDAAGNVVSAGGQAGKVVGTAGADILNLDDDAPPIVDGADGNDILTGGSSGDVLIGGDGNDSLIGGTGRDTLQGDAGKDILDGGLGADVMTGGKGNDTYVVDDIDDVVTEDIYSAAGGIDLVNSSVDWFLRFGIENLTLTGSDNIYGSGNNLNNIITGNSGNNLLIGAYGVDTLIGGTGDDTYIIDLNTEDARQDKITEAANAGNDTLKLQGSSTDTKAVNVTLAANLEHLDASDTESSKLNLTGNAISNTLIGNNWDNTFDGGKDIDSYIGGAGNDLYLIDNLAETNVTELTDEGIDTVRLRVDKLAADKTSDSYTLADKVENLIITGKAQLDILGNDSNNSLVGNNKANQINGADGDDQLSGGLGMDGLTGGDGVDTFVFNMAPSKTNIDTITDFAVGIDKIGLDGKIFKKLLGDTDLTDNFERIAAAGKASDSSHYLLYNPDSGNLYYDADGSGRKAMILVGVLNTDTEGLHPQLTAGDFVVV